MAAAASLSQLVTVLVATALVYPCLSAARFLLPTDSGGINAPITESQCPGSLAASQPPSNDSLPIIVTAFFPFPPAGSNATSTARDSVHHLLPAAVIAVEELNNRLDGYYHLQLDVRNTQCDPYVAIQELVESSHGSASHFAVLGPSCLDVVSAATPIAARLFLPVISYSYGTNTPVASVNKERNKDAWLMVRNVYRTTQTAVRLLDYFGYTENVAFMYKNDQVYSRTVEKLAHFEGDEVLLTVGSSEVKIPQAVFIELGDSAARETVSEFMQNIRKSYIRVVAGLMEESHACQLLCEAKRGTIPGSGFVWVFVGNYQERWWQNEEECTCTLTEADVNSVLLVSSQVKNTNNSKIIVSGSKYSDLKAEYLNRLHKWCPSTIEATYTPNTFFATVYDAVWTLGLALNDTLWGKVGARNRSYGDASILSNKSEVLESLSNSLANTDFVGASGHVIFDSKRERIGVDVVQQLQSGRNTLVGTFNAEDTLVIQDQLLRWPGNTSSPPSNHPKQSQESVKLWIIILCIIPTIGGVALAIFMLAFIIRYREHFILKASGQRLNYFILAGCFVAYFTVFVLALLESDAGRDMPKGLYSFFCIVRLYGLTVSFTLTYGTMFARAWRIYRIFNNPFMSKNKYSDTHLMMIVGFLALIDVVILTVFVAGDKYGRYLRSQEVDYEEYGACVYLACYSSSSTFFLFGTAANACYKVGQMFLFSFIISLVRKGIIERKIYDDSTALAISLYVTEIFFVAGLSAQVISILTYRLDIALVANAIWVNVGTDVCLIALYGFKFHQIVIKKVNVQNLKKQKSKFYLYKQSSINFDRQGSVGSLGSEGIYTRQPSTRGVL